MRLVNNLISGPICQVNAMSIIGNIMRQTFFLGCILCIISFTIDRCTWIKSVKGPESNLRILIDVRDEEGNPIGDAKVTMIEGEVANRRRGEPRRISFKTHQDGNISIQPIYRLPFRIEVSHSEEFISQTEEIYQHLFPGNKLSTKVSITLPRRKTVIVGKVVDKDTTDPIALANIEVSPLELMEKTDETGNYRIESSLFYEWTIYTVSAERTEKGMINYEKDFQQVKIVNYWGENEVAEIRLKAIPRDTVVVTTDDPPEIPEGTEWGVPHHPVKQDSVDTNNKVYNEDK